MFLYYKREKYEEKIVLKRRHFSYARFCGIFNRNALNRETVNKKAGKSTKIENI